MKRSRIMHFVVFLGLMALSPQALSEEAFGAKIIKPMHLDETPTFDKLNIELKKVHTLYKAKRFDELGLIKDSFIRTVEKFEEAIDAGKIKLRYPYQKEDVALAKSYKKSFSTVWNELLSKYGHKPSPVLVEVPAKIKTPVSTEDELNEEFELAEGKEFQLSDLNKLIPPKDSSFEPPQDELDTLNEKVLEEEISVLDFKLVEYLMDNYFKEKYKHKTPPKTPEIVLTDAEKGQVAKTKEEQESANKALQTKVEAKQKKLLLDKIKAIKDEERQIISKEVEKVKIIRENQARFEITKMNEDEEITPVEVKPSRNKIVNTRDRLLDNEDDVIILTVPSLN